MISPLSEVLLAVEVDMVLAESGFLVEKGTILHELATLGEEKKVALFSSVLPVTSCSWGLFSSLGWTGGHWHLSWYFWSLLICQIADTTTKVS